MASYFISQGVELLRQHYKQTHPAGTVVGFLRWLKRQRRKALKKAKIGG